MATATARVTDASARFMNALLALEPGTQDSGIYTNKPGYHGTRAENQARDRVDGDTDYSVEHPLDLLGPSDKAAAYDWTHPKAQAGNYATMAKYGDRLKAAFNARDPRLFGWREALGQTDLDATPEGLDFDGWFTRTPDSSHAWHWHFSEHRAYVASWVNKQCMLSVLRGETLGAYLAAGGQLLEGAMGIFEEIWRTDQIPNPYGDKATNPTIWAQTALVNIGGDAAAAKTDAAKARAAAELAVKELDTVKAELAALKEMVATGGLDLVVLKGIVTEAVSDALGTAFTAAGSAVDPE